MRTKKWIEVSDKEPYKATKHSGGENQQFKGSAYDARDRKIASASGGTVTAKVLTRPGKHVPADKGWNKTPDSFSQPMPYSKYNKKGS